MSRAQTLAELRALQEAFGAALATPLDRSTGTLRATCARYPAALTAALADGPRTSAQDRLAVYQRQVWFRHLTILQTAYPLLARLLGLWHFNDLAARYLAAHPPTHYDLTELPHALPAYVRAAPYTLPGCALDALLLVEAAELDDAIGRVFLAPEVPLLDARALTPERFAQTALRLSPAHRLLAMHYALVPARRSALAEPGEGRIPAPARLAAPSHWLVQRTADGYTLRLLEPLAYALYTRLSQAPIAEALAELEQSVPEAERAALPARVEALLRESVRGGFWCALEG